MAYFDSVPALTRLCASPHAAKVAAALLQNFRGMTTCVCLRNTHSKSASPFGCLILSRTRRQICT